MVVRRLEILLESNLEVTVRSVPIKQPSTSGFSEIFISAGKAAT